MVNKLLNNPIIKIIGVLTILYFALLHDKTNPESLGNRLSAERVKKNIHEIEEKGKFIATNISMARKYAKQEINNSYSSKIAIKDIKINNEGQILKCGDKAEISYDILTINDKIIYSTENEELVIGSRKKDFLEKNIVEMHEGSTRSILIPQDVYTNNIQLTNFLKENKEGLNYQVTLKKVTNNPNSLNISCE